MTFTYRDLMDLPLSDFEWYAERMHEQREAEAAAMRRK